MSENLKVVRFCGQYAQLFEQRARAKHQQLNELDQAIDETEQVLKECQSKLNAVNTYFSKASMTPEIHLATVNHVATLSEAIANLYAQLEDFQLRRSDVEQALKLLKLKKQVIGNKADKFKLLERDRVNHLQAKQLEQLWVINNGGKPHA